MSRVGKKPVQLPEGVQAEISGNIVVIKGNKGELSYTLPAGIGVAQEAGQLVLSRKNETKVAKSLHGAMQRILANAVAGVTSGWEQKLELQGTGYRSRIEGKNLVLTIGFSHPVTIIPPEEITFMVQENIITVAGIDKHLVGQIAANIRSARKPDAYKGKGVRYLGERVRLKPGKAATKGA